jgi:hypothetical protein
MVATKIMSERKGQSISFELVDTELLENTRQEIQTAIAEAFSGFRLVDINNEMNDIKDRLHFTQKLAQNGYIEDELAELIYRRILEDYLNIKIWNFFVNKFVPEKAGASKINQICKILVEE